MSAHAEVEEQIERLSKGNTLPENEVKVLCEKVRKINESIAQSRPPTLSFFLPRGERCSSELELFVYGLY